MRLSRTVHTLTGESRLGPLLKKLLNIRVHESTYLYQAVYFTSATKICHDSPQIAVSNYGTRTFPARGWECGGNGHKGHEG